MGGGADPPFHIFALSVTSASLPAGRVWQSYRSPAPLRKGAVTPHNNLLVQNQDFGNFQ